MRNEPNPSHDGLVEDQKMRNKPNLPPRSHHPHPQICETNPIPSRWLPQFRETNPIPNYQYTIYNIQYTTPWPNLNKIVIQQLNRRQNTNKVMTLRVDRDLFGQPKPSRPGVMTVERDSA